MTSTWTGVRRDPAFHRGVSGWTNRPRGGAARLTLRRYPRLASSSAPPTACRRPPARERPYRPPHDRTGPPVPGRRAAGPDGRVVGRYRPSLRRRPLVGDRHQRRDGERGRPGAEQCRPPSLLDQRHRPAGDDGCRPGQVEEPGRRRLRRPVAVAGGAGQQLLVHRRPGGRSVRPPLRPAALAAGLEGRRPGQGAGHEALPRLQPGRPRQPRHAPGRLVRRRRMEPEGAAPGVRAGRRGPAARIRRARLRPGAVPPGRRRDHGQLGARLPGEHPLPRRDPAPGDRTGPAAHGGHPRPVPRGRARRSTAPCSPRAGRSWSSRRSTA